MCFPAAEFHLESDPDDTENSSAVPVAESVRSEFAQRARVWLGQRATWWRLWCVAKSEIGVLTEVGLSSRAGAVG